LCVSAPETGAISLFLGILEVIVAEAGGELERRQNLQSVIAVARDSIEAGRDVRAVRPEALDEGIGINIAGLIARSQHQSLTSRLEYLLDFGRVGGQLARVINLGRSLGDTDDLPGGILRGDEPDGVGIGEREFILQPPGQNERMNSRRPFVMVTSIKIRRLRLLDPHGPARRVLIVVLQHVAGLVFGIIQLEEERIVQRELLFDPSGKVEILDVLVRGRSPGSNR